MTNRDIAKKIGVSPATLSLVINNKPGITQKTREYVLNKLNDCGLSHILKYPEHNVNNKNLCFIIFRRHGEIVDSSPFFMLLTQTIQSFAQERGYNVFIAFFDKKMSSNEQIERFKKMNCIGAIIFATEMLDDDISFLSQLPFPIVLLDNSFPLLNYDSIAINNEMGTYQAIESLYNNGFRVIGYLKSKTYINSFGEREQGYNFALNHFNLDLKKEFIIELGYSLENSYHDFSNYLDSHPHLPEAFVSDDDTIANGAVRALIEHGYKVPHDISIVGFNDRPLCEQMYPKLDSIRVMKEAFGGFAIACLIHKLETNAQYNLKLRIGTKYISRDTVKTVSL